MARPKTKGHWEELIKGYTENEPRLGPLGIRPRLEQAKREVEAAGEVDKDALGAIPGLRTIGRIQQRFRDLPDKERQPYRQFRWPESMETGALPWEASTAALELLQYLHQAGKARPPIRVVEWFWRISTIAPNAPKADIEQRHYAAVSLFTVEARPDRPGHEVSRRAIEWWLAYRPWVSDAAGGAYEVALQLKESGAGDDSTAERPPRFPEDAVLDLGGQGEAVRDAIQAILGLSVRADMERVFRDVLRETQVSKDKKEAPQ